MSLKNNFNEDCELDIMDLGRCLIKARNYNKFSTAKLSDKSGINLDIINMIEKGKHDPDYKTLKKIAKALGVSLSKLLNDIDMSIED